MAHSTVRVCEGRNEGTQPTRRSANSDIEAQDREIPSLGTSKTSSSASAASGSVRGRFAARSIVNFRLLFGATKQGRDLALGG